VVRATHTQASHTPPTDKKTGVCAFAFDRQTPRKARDRMVETRREGRRTHQCAPVAPCRKCLWCLDFLSSGRDRRLVIGRTVHTCKRGKGRQANATRLDASQILGPYHAPAGEEKGEKKVGCCHVTRSCLDRSAGAATTSPPAWVRNKKLQALRGQARLASKSPCQASFVVSFLVWLQTAVQASKAYTSIHFPDQKAILILAPGTKNTKMISINRAPFARGSTSSTNTLVRDDKPSVKAGPTELLMSPPHAVLGVVRRGNVAEEGKARISTRLTFLLSSPFRLPHGCGVGWRCASLVQGQR
jgi:hypothetical protein